MDVDFDGVDLVTGYVIKDREWWWFFTQPLVYSVYWMPDGSKTMEQFLHEQIALIRRRLIATDWERPRWK